MSNIGPAWPSSFKYKIVKAGEPVKTYDILTAVATSAQKWSNEPSMGSIYTLQAKRKWGIAQIIIAYMYVLEKIFMMLYQLDKITQ